MTDVKSVLEPVRMDLYLNYVEARDEGDSIIFFGVGKQDFTWAIPKKNLRGFGTSHKINVIVDAFRREFGQLGA